jgi:hypothetical protein
MSDGKKSILEVELDFNLNKFNSAFPVLQDYPYLHLSGSEVMLTHPLSFFELRENISYNLDSDNEFVGSIIRSLQAKELSRYRIRELISISIFKGPIESLNLSTRTYNCLKRDNLNSIAEMMEKTFQDLTDIYNFGRGSADDLFYSLLLLVVIDLEFKAGRKYLETPHLNLPRMSEINFDPPEGVNEELIKDWIANNREIYESAVNQELGSQKFPNFSSDQDNLFFKVANVLQSINPEVTFGELLKMLSVFQIKPISEVHKWQLITKNNILNLNDNFDFKHWGNFLHDWNSKDITILVRRLLKASPDTLQEIANDLSLTRERIRQIENNVRDAIFAEVSDKESILPILSSYFIQLVGNVARKSILLKNHEWLNTIPILSFTLDSEGIPRFVSYENIVLIDVLIMVSPNIKTYGDLIMGGQLLIETHYLENLADSSEDDFGFVHNSYRVDKYRDLFDGIYSDDQSFTDICDLLNFELLWKSLVPLKLTLGKKLAVILTEAQIPLEIFSINSALNHNYAKKSVLNELQGNRIFEQTFEGLWQIRKDSNSFEFNSKNLIGIDSGGQNLVDQDDLETIELDSSRVIKLKKQG